MTKSATDHFATDHLKNDADLGKGGQEPDERGQAANNSLRDQLGHRQADVAADGAQDGADSDFPEPGESPEHSFEGKPRSKEVEEVSNTEPIEQATV